MSENGTGIFESASWNLFQDFYMISGYTVSIAYMTSADILAFLRASAWLNWELCSLIGQEANLLCLADTAQVHSFPFLVLAAYLRF